MPTLVERVHERLVANGPSYATRLAEDLACPSRGSVSGALGILRRRGLVVVDHEEWSPRCGTPRIIYAAVAPAPALVDGDPDPDPLRREITLLDLEQRYACGAVDPDVLEVALANDPVPGL